MLKTREELDAKSSAYYYGYIDGSTGNVPLNQWAGDADYKWAADDYEQGYTDSLNDLQESIEAD